MGILTNGDKSLKIKLLLPCAAMHRISKMVTTFLVPMTTYKQYISTRKPTHSLPLTSVALNTHTPSTGPATVLWDTDSYPIRVDNCCTRTISFNLNDFDSNTLEPVTNRTVSGFVEGSTTAIEQKGTIKWKILDDLGIIRELSKPNSFYVPDGTSRLLSSIASTLGPGSSRRLPHKSRY
jgi:hypothetical protein